MKTLTFFILALFLAVTVSAQTPQSFRYQAVARDNSGNILANQSVSFRISILSGSISGTAVYSETYNGKSTNSFGLVELELGKGSPLSGTFSTIDWGSNNYFVKIEMDPAGGSVYQILSTSQLLSVPYALYANKVKENDDADADPTNELQTLSVIGNDISITDGNSVPLPKSITIDSIGLKLSSVTIEISGLKTRNVLSIEYSIHRSVDSDGQPTSKVSIDYIKVRAKALEDGNHEFFEWMCSPFEYKDGKVAYNLNGNKIKELEFKRGYIIKYQEIYNGNYGLIEEFEISPQEIKMGGASIKEVWAEEVY